MTEMSIPPHGSRPRQIRVSMISTNRHSISHVEACLQKLNLEICGEALEEKRNNSQQNHRHPMNSSVNQETGRCYHKVENNASWRTPGIRIPPARAAECCELLSRENLT